MSKYYNPRKGQKYLFDPKSEAPFRISRSKLDLFLNCPRCFYFDLRLGVSRPPGYPFTLNSAVDALLKKEFDAHRKEGTRHPLMEKYNIDAVPFNHKNIEVWRDSLRNGIEFHHKKSNFSFRGGVDDVWVTPAEEVIIVDYKATSKTEEVNLDAEWQIGYKRQMEVYQWLFRKNGFEVSDTGYFVYCNGDTDKESFNARLDFDIKIIPYKGDDSWVEKALVDARKTLEKDILPEVGEDCDFCAYRKAAQDVSAGFIKEQKSLF